VLEGSVRKAGHRVRITGQLIDTATGAHIWAERFDGPLDDIFELQEQVAASVAGAVVPRLRQSEVERATRKPAQSLNAYDLYLRALAKWNVSDPESWSTALSLSGNALAIDPEYAPAAALIGQIRATQTTIGTRVSRAKLRKPSGWLGWRSTEARTTRMCWRERATRFRCWRATIPPLPPRSNKPSPSIRVPHWRGAISEP
jgi:hypothetical protein